MYNIVEACRYRGVKKVVFASSVATYGDPEADEVDEMTPFSGRPAARAGALCREKIIGENLLRLYKQRYGLDYVALRYATVYGGESDCLWCKRAQWKQILTSGR